jgi:ribose transport system permease protein
VTFKDSLLDLLQKSWLFFILLLVIAYFGYSLPTAFPTIQNFRNITGNQAVLGIVSLGLIIPLVAGQIDMSLGAVLGLSNVVTAAVLSKYEAPVWLASLIGVACGAGVGFLNGLVIAKFRTNSLITTVGVASVITGVITWYTGGLAILTGIPDSLTALGSGTWLGLPRAVYFLIIAALFTWYLLDHTPFGRYLQAIGINVHAARLVGLNVDRLIVSSFMVAGALAGAAGVLLVARQGSGNPQVAAWYTLPAMSAAFLGATSIRPGKFNVLGTLLAILFLAVVSSGFSLSGIDSWAEAVFNGGALAVAVVVSGIIEKRRATV